MIKKVLWMAFLLITFSISVSAFDYYQNFNQEYTKGCTVADFDEVSTWKVSPLNLTLNWYCNSDSASSSSQVENVSNRANLNLFNSGGDNAFMGFILDTSDYLNFQYGNISFYCEQDSDTQNSELIFLDSSGDVQVTLGMGYFNTNDMCGFVEHENCCSLTQFATVNNRCRETGQVITIDLADVLSECSAVNTNSNFRYVVFQTGSGGADTDIQIDNLNLSTISEGVNQLPSLSISNYSSSICLDQETGIANFTFDIDSVDPEGDIIYYATENNYATGTAIYINRSFWRITEDEIAPDITFFDSPYFITNDTITTTWAEWFGAEDYRIICSLDGEYDDCALGVYSQATDFYLTPDRDYIEDIEFRSKFIFPRGIGVQIWNVTLLDYSYQDELVLDFDYKNTNTDNLTIQVDSVEIFNRYVNESTHFYLNINKTDENITVMMDTLGDWSNADVYVYNSTNVLNQIKFTQEWTVAFYIDEFSFIGSVTEYVPSYSATKPTSILLGWTGKHNVRFWVTDEYELTENDLYTDVIVTVQSGAYCYDEDTLGDSVIISPLFSFMNPLIDALGIRDQIDTIFYMAYILVLMLSFFTLRDFNISFTLSSVMFLFFAVIGFGSVGNIITMAILVTLAFLPNIRELIL